MVQIRISVNCRHGSDPVPIQIRVDSLFKQMMWITSLCVGQFGFVNLQARNKIMESFAVYERVKWALRVVVLTTHMIIPGSARRSIRRILSDTIDFSNTDDIAVILEISIVIGIMTAQSHYYNAQA